MATRAVPIREAPAGGVDATSDPYWWVHLVTGVVWLLFGFAILNGREEISTVWTVAVLAGVLFLAYAAGECTAAFVSESWSWLHAVLAVGSAIAGVVAFAWPGQTFLTLAAIVAWYLLFVGVVGVISGFAARDVEEFWWVMVLVALGEVLLAFWAMGYPGRSIQLLVLWLSLSALARGMLQVVMALSAHSTGGRT